MGQCHCCHGGQKDAGRDADAEGRRSPSSEGRRRQVDLPPTAIDGVDAPAASGSDGESTGSGGDAPRRDALTPLRGAPGQRRPSSDGERGSASPLAPAAKRGLKAALGRSLSLKLQRTTPRAEVLNSTSWVGCEEAKQQQQEQHQQQHQQQHRQRSTSLRLPRRPRRRPRNFSTKLPTIYVDDAELRRGRQELTRKTSLNRALSLLSVNSPSRQEAPQKPVQRILRQPQRRHDTVRGLSGMAIGASNQASLHRYYPASSSSSCSSSSRHLPRPTSSTLDY